MEYLHAFTQGLINILPFLTPHGTETFLYMTLGMADRFLCRHSSRSGGRDDVGADAAVYLQHGPDDGICLSPGLQRRHRHDWGCHLDSLRGSG